VSDSDTPPAPGPASAPDAPPDTLEAMGQRLAREHASLSPRLQDVGRYVASHPQSIAVDTLAQIAERAGSHPSTLVRFAHHFGFGGFSELQRLYKQHVHEHFAGAGADYGVRIRQLQQTLGDNDAVTPPQLLDEFTEANLLSLQQLRTHIDPAQLIRAVDLLEAARTVHVCGIRRAFPVAMYVNYALSHIGVDCRAIDGLGMMQDSQVRALRDDDVLVAITFNPYAPEVQAVIAGALAAGSPVILLTDRGDAPGAIDAQVVFAVQDAEVRSFRSLNASLCLAQSLCIALGYRREALTGDRP